MIEKEFKEILKIGTLVFMVEKNTKNQYVVKLQENIKSAESFYYVRFLYRNFQHLSFVGMLPGATFLPGCQDVCGTYIIKEEFWDE